MRARPLPPDTSSLPALAVVVLVAGVLGCAGTPEPQEDLDGAPREGLAAAPVWLLQDCTAHWGDAADGQLCGVGSAAGPANPSLMRSTALGRGRTEVARHLHTRLQALLDELAAAGAPGGGSSREPRWDPIDVSKQITDASLSGAALAESWTSPHGTFYALVSLDVASFSEALNGLGTLPDPLRRAVLERADTLFAAPERRTGAPRRHALSPARPRPPPETL